MTTALERLTTGYYNARSYDPVTNPGGFGNGGHRINLDPWSADLASVAQAMNAAVLDAAQVSADKATVVTAKNDTLAAAGPVIAGMATYGFPGRVQITNLNTLALSGHFYATTTATGRPAGETDGFVFSTSDGAADNGSQLFHSKTNGKLYKRFRTAGAWQNWEELTTAAATNDTAFGAESTLASAATTNIGSAATRMVEITGVTTITSLGASAVTTNPHYMVRFAGALTLTHNAASLILPGGKNIATAAGDHALLQYLGSGNWKCLAYFRASGETLVIAGYGAEASIASAATVDLGAAAALAVQITGTTTVTSLGSSASTARPFYRVRFAGVLTLTHNAASLILPGGGNIVTASGDAALFQYLGGGNWKCLSYARVDGKLLPAALANAADAAAGTDGGKAMTPATAAGVIQSGVQLFAIDSSAAANDVVIALTPAPAALTAGMTVWAKVQATNTGPATLNLNGLGAISIKLLGAALVAGDLQDGQIYAFTYDGSFWQLQSARSAIFRSHGYASVTAIVGTLFADNIFTLARSGSGSYSVTLANPANSVADWGIKLFLGNAGGSQNLGPTEKTKTTSVLTFQVRNGGNSLDDPSSIDIEVWLRR